MEMENDNNRFISLAKLGILVVLTSQVAQGWLIDPTLGFTQLPLNASNFHIQKPYNLPVEERYSFIHGIHRLWVYSTDKPLSYNSPTNPRTEIMLREYIYSSGVWQFEGCGYVPSGSTGMCIMQVFGAHPCNTTLMLRVYNGTLSYYSKAVVEENIYDRWFRLNVIHDVERSHLKVYVDGILKLEVAGRGGTTHYFKCGVYAQDHYSYYMESRWKNIKVLTKNVY